MARGEAFLLQGGDCAETFVDSTADAIRNKIKTLLQMAVVLTYGAQVPVVKVGRIAGQFAKPRSARPRPATASRLPSYRGDAVNGLEFTPEARTPDPHRLLQVYNTSAATLNLVRAFTQGGLADLREVHSWNQGFVAASSAHQRYEAMARDIDRALAFMAAAGVDPEAFRTVDLYSSHEALLLDYERALTRIDSRTGLPYDVSGHLVWVGERTRDLDGAHVEFAASIRNPVAVKLGPTTTPGRGAGAGRAAQPGRRARPAHLRHPDGLRPGARRAAAGRREGHRERRDGRVGLRPDARQHLRGARRAEDPALRRRHRRGARLLRGAPRAGHPPRRPAHGAHRRRRHRVPRRVAAASARSTCRCATRRPATRG